MNINLREKVNSNRVRLVIYGQGLNKKLREMVIFISSNLSKSWLSIHNILTVECGLSHPINLYPHSWEYLNSDEFGYYCILYQNFTTNTDTPACIYLSRPSLLVSCLVSELQFTSVKLGLDTQEGREWLATFYTHIFCPKPGMHSASLCPEQGGLPLR